MAGASATGAAGAGGAASALAIAAGAGSMTAGDAAGVGAGVAAAGADGSSRITGEDSCPPSHSLLSGKPMAARTTTTAAAAPSVPIRLRPAAGTLGITGGCADAFAFGDGPATALGRAGRAGFASATAAWSSTPGSATVCAATGAAGCSALMRIFGGSGRLSRTGAAVEGASAAGAAAATGAATTTGTTAAGTEMTDVSATGNGCAERAIDVGRITVASTSGDAPDGSNCARALLSNRVWNAFLHVAQRSPSSAAPPQLSQRDPRTSASSCVAGTSTGGRSMTATAVDVVSARSRACTCAKGESATGAGATCAIPAGD